MPDHCAHYLYMKLKLLIAAPSCIESWNQIQCLTDHLNLPINPPSLNKYCFWYCRALFMKTCNTFSFTGGEEKMNAYQCSAIYWSNAHYIMLIPTIWAETENPEFLKVLGIVMLSSLCCLWLFTCVTGNICALLGIPLELLFLQPFKS